METSGQIQAVTPSLLGKKPMVPTEQEAGWYRPLMILDNVPSVKKVQKNPGINTM
jgi:hypothetical protein